MKFIQLLNTKKNKRSSCIFLKGRRLIEFFRVAFVILLFSFFSLFWGVRGSIFAQIPGEWTWMHGNSPSVFGTQGVANPANEPPALYEPCEWTDNNGNFWLFGGIGLDFYAALWKYNPVSNQWAWMKGPSAGNQLGVYGTQGVPSPGNYPGARAQGAVTWTDALGNFWLFGGWGYDAVGWGGYLNDLWKYDVSTDQWTWMHGSNTGGNLGSYGTKGVSNPSNLPPSRAETSCSWTDNAGNLWLYGGESVSANALWKYDISVNQWAWMHGANTGNPPPVYGTQGLAAPVNTPGARVVYCSWVDLAGDLWLFGGWNLNTGAQYNDLWKYNIAGNQWTWMNGPSTPNDTGNYGTQCVSTNNNMPPARYENRARVRDGCGNFWNFGGGRAGPAFFNDLWHYNVSVDQWTWVSGDNILNQAAVYGTLGVSSSANKPGAKMGSVAWIDSNGYIWIFGGYNSGNDLFRYVPDPACVPVSSVVTVSSNITICSGQSATLTASGGTSYSWSPGGQSTSGVVVSPTASTTYTVTSNNACGFNSSSIVVIVSPLPLITASSTTICNGKSTTLIVSGGTNYSWSNGQTTSSINIVPSATTTYSVVVSNGSCSDTVTATVTVIPGITATVTNSTICAGQNATLTALGGSIYSWSTGNTNSTINFSPSSTSTYSVVVSNGNCSDTASTIVVVNPNPIAIAWSNPTATGQVVTITAGNSATLSASGGISYIWNNGSAASTITVTPPITTVYCVTVMDVNNCTNSVCLTVYVEPIDCSTSTAEELYIPNAFSPNGDNENDALKMYYGNILCIKTFKLVIYNRWGEKIFTATNPLSEWDGYFKGKLENTAVFVYYLQVMFISGKEIIRKGNVSLLK